MTEWAASILLVAGAFFVLLAALGVLRFPDLFTRMHACTMSVTLGVGCVLLAAAVYFQDFGVTLRVISVIVFFFLTAPVAAHLIARAAYRTGLPLWKRTIMDELSDHKSKTRKSTSQKGTD